MKKVDGTERLLLYFTTFAFLFLGAAFGWGHLVGERIPPFMTARFRPPKPAYDFTLTDQHGQPFHLADDKGKVVALAFAFTHCEDECPFIAEKLRVTHELLRSQASQVDFVLVTVDPARDTPQRLTAYGKEFGMNRVWHFLTGTRAQLKPVWNAYDSMASGVLDMSGYSVETGLTGGQISLADQAISLFAGGADMDHPMLTWLIDRNMRVVGVVEWGRPPEDIARDIRALLRR